MTTLNKGTWNQLKGTLKQKFAQLTDDDLMFIEGKEDELYGKLQKRLGKSKEEIQKMISDSQSNSHNDHGSNKHSADNQDSKSELSSHKSDHQKGGDTDTQSEGDFTKGKSNQGSTSSTHSGSYSDKHSDKKTEPQKVK
jgi:uncharacterized protein YjbJ (UPF0337 family)